MFGVSFLVAAPAALAVWLQDAGAADWTEQHAPGAPWWTWLVGLGLIGVLFLLAAQGIARRRDFQGRHVLQAADLAAIQRAVAAAEKRTVGEIVPVILDRSDRYPAADLWCGVSFALAAELAAWCLTPGLSEGPTLALTLGAGALGWLLARTLPELRRRFVAPWRMREMAEEQAFQEFYRQGLHRTQAATGVLLFVSLLERRVIVMADEGIDKLVTEGTWKQVHALVLDAARDGRLGAGLVAAVERIGELLVEKFPWTEGDRNEVPDRVVVRRD